MTALDVVESRPTGMVVDLTCDTFDSAHGESIRIAIDELSGFHVRNLSDRTFLTHLGGKIEVQPKSPIRHRDDLSRVYTPGVARVCLAIANNPGDVRGLTIKRNTVAVVSDGSAVLGLGNLGPLAALPVMEGKAALFKQFAGVDAWPICLDTQDPDEIVAAVRAIAPGFGGINLEDIAAPRCFEIERRLRQELDIPVFHDDQHGTAVVVLAALTNALRVVEKALAEVRIVVAGAGAAGTALVRLLHGNGARQIRVFDIDGAVHQTRSDLNPPDGATDPDRRWLVENTNPDNFAGTLREGIAGADVFIGVSAPGLLSGEDIATMAADAIVFALANPDPEVDPIAAMAHATVVATGRSDLPNQINNVLAFPGVFRGLLDAGATVVAHRMLTAAAQALAECVAADELNSNYVVPSVFDPAVASAVAAAVRDSAR
jgi:malate dehydrogenase (oxaloacetate-decarboxylating)